MKKKKKKKSAAGIIEQSNPMPQNPAADLETYLKSRMNDLPCRDLIRNISVSESGDGKSLNVTIVPKCGEAVSLGTLKISLENVNGSLWKRKKKDAWAGLKGYRPKVDPKLSGRILEEANACLTAWREDHPFSDELRSDLFSQKAYGFLSPGKINTLRFLAGEKMLTSQRTEVLADAVHMEFNGIPYKAVCALPAGTIKFTLSKADFLLHQFELVRKEIRTKEAIGGYLTEKGIPGEVQYAGKPGTFCLLFDFALSREKETVTVGTAFRRIVMTAYRNARDRERQREKKLEKYLKTCPWYGTFVAQAVLTSLEENKKRLTRGQLVNLLRGVNVSADYVFGEYSGKYNLMPKSEVREVVDCLVRFGIVGEWRVHGEYQDYYTCFVTPEGKFFERLQSEAVPKKRPVTEQEYHLVLTAVREDIPRLEDKEKQKLLQAVISMRSLFLTDPELILDCVEQMGEPAAEYLRDQYKNEETRTDKRILKLLLNAASGKGKEVPKNGLDAFRERNEKKRRKKEEEEKRDRELFQLVLTEIPDNYVDLYPAARLMHRKFVLHIGPTNSGKTHDAVQELMRADNGIYLAPLRLLAYEQYERLNRAECPCSLVTGEEQFLIDGARHQSSTIEMVSLKTRYEVAVIDEAQMIADRSRGGAWTAAIMGVCADTVYVCAAPEAEQRLVEIIKDCGDEYKVVHHRRMTPLEYEEEKFIFPDDVKPGDALIVFSRRNVHAVAAQLWKKHVSCSIIYGALPYDVRHKQAELFAAGKTDVVVATDAIGMGMNLPIRRVVLMETVKYDGFERRSLTYGEIKQIIGRAGRYGIYNVGYAAAADDGWKVKKAVHKRLDPIGEAVIDFPETLLTVDASILDLIKKWEQVIPAKGWCKESVEHMHRMAEMTEDLNAPKHLAYDFLTIPFEDENGELLQIWLDIYEKEVKGKEYSIFDQAAAVVLKSPSAADAIDALEQQHRVLDLYYALARKFQPLESTLEFIMEKKRICSERIMKVLAKRGFREKRCRICGRPLPWNHPYGMCSRCWDKRM